jgi:TP53 regulating kinase-like protein
MSSNHLNLLLQRVWEGKFLGRDVIVKERFNKLYRHPTLDSKLTSQRLRQEVRSMLRARKLAVPAPVVYHVDQDTSSIYMERVPGHSLKTVLQSSELTEAEQIELMESLGKMVAQLHDGKVIHGDLTSSNVLVTTNCDGKRSLVMIDFGLSFFSSIYEDKAVDLYVLERAFTSAHAGTGETLFAACLEAYRKSSRYWISTLNRFADGKF